jgi:uncharacterized membrane protein
MDRKTAVIIVICLIGFISFRIYIAMNVPTSEPARENLQSTFDFPAGLPAVYTGTLPCASCPGIDTHLLIDSTGFREVNSYQDEEEGPFATYGTWSRSGGDANGDTLTLTSGEEVYKQYLIVNSDTLRMLNTSGNQIEGDLEESYLLSYSNMENQIRRRHEEVRQRGFKFIAAGNEPFWSVRVTSNDVVIYRTPQIRKSGSMEQGAITGGSGSVTAEFGSGQTLELTYSEEFCRDSMSGFLFTHTVTMQYDNEPQQRGCGRFLNDVLSAR